MSNKYSSNLGQNHQIFPLIQILKTLVRRVRTLNQKRPFPVPNNDCMCNCWFKGKMRTLLVDIEVPEIYEKYFNACSQRVNWQNTNIITNS